ncbi:serine hydrolase [Oerskovia sp. M15]
MATTASERTPGPTGLSQFRRAASVAVEDLLYLAMAVSDDAAADALFALCPPTEVNATLRSLGIADITLRHPIHELHRTLASGSARTRCTSRSRWPSGRRPRARAPRPQLDVTQANAGTARGLVRLLREVWTGQVLERSTVETTRALLAKNLLRNRLAPDLESDASTWSSKTGTFSTCATRPVSWSTRTARPSRSRC